MEQSLHLLLLGSSYKIVGVSNLVHSYLLRLPLLYIWNQIWPQANNSRKSSHCRSQCVYYSSSSSRMSIDLPHTYSCAVSICKLEICDIILRMLRYHSNFMCQWLWPSLPGLTKVDMLLLATTTIYLLHAPSALGHLWLAQVEVINWSISMNYALKSYIISP